MPTEEECQKKERKAEEDEKLPYFNKYDEFLGVASRKRIHDESLLHRHVAFYITNKRNELLLQLRSKFKRVNPNQWDKPEGHVSICEEYEDASRELVEEVCHGIEGIRVETIDASRFELRCHESDLRNTIVITELDYKRNYNATRVLKDGSIEAETIHLKSFRGRYDGPIHPYPAEVQAAKWVSQNALEKELDLDCARKSKQYGYDLKDAMSRFREVIFSRALL